MTLLILDQHSISTMNILDCNTTTKQSMCWTSCGEKISSLIGCNFDLAAPIATIAVIAFIIGIDYELNIVNLITTRIETHNGIGYHWDSSFLLILSFTFDEIISHLHRLSKIEYVNGNNSNVTININNFCKIRGTAIVVGFFSTVIYLVCAGFTNVSIKHIDIYDTDQLSRSGALFGIYANNHNVSGKSRYIMDTVTITKSTDILAIVEESTVNNSDGTIELKSVDLYNFLISDNQGIIIYHSYTQKSMSRIQIVDSECTSNVHSGLQVSTSNNLIVTEEDGSGCQQLPVITIDDASFISHFIMINNQFRGNIFEVAFLIDTCDCNNNENDGNDTCIDTTDLYTVTSNFNKCKVPQYSAPIYDLSDSTLIVVSTSFRDNTIVSNDGGCMALYDSSMMCDKSTFYNMSGNNDGGTIYAVSGGSTIDTISLIDCSFDEWVPLNDGGIMYATTQMEFDIIRNNLTDSCARCGDGDVFLNQSQGSDGSLSNTILSVEFDASIGAFAPLILNSTAQLSISALYCKTEVIGGVFQHRAARI